MKALLQRVAEARVEIAGQTVGEIAQGLLVLVCAERGDSEAQADKLLAKILKLRIFGDDAGKMNRCKSIRRLEVELAIYLIAACALQSCIGG